MKVRDLIHSLTEDNVDLDADVVYVNVIDIVTDQTKEYQISSVGYDINAKKVLLNNLY